MPVGSTNIEFLENQTFTSFADEVFDLRFRIADNVLGAVHPVIHVTVNGIHQPSWLNIIEHENGIYGLYTEPGNINAGALRIEIRFLNPESEEVIFDESFRFNVSMPEVAIVRGVSAKGVLSIGRVIAAGGPGATPGNVSFTAITVAAALGVADSLALASPAKFTFATPLDDVFGNTLFGEHHFVGAFNLGSLLGRTTLDLGNINWGGARSEEEGEESEGAHMHHIEHGVEQSGFAIFMIKLGDNSQHTFHKAPAQSEPPIAEPDTFNITEDADGIINVLQNDIDPDTGDTLTVTDAQIIQGLGTVSIVNNQVLYDPTGVYDFLPEEGSELVVIQYTVSDNTGLTDTTTVNVLVQGVNDVPVAVVDSVGINENDVVNVNVLANDTDVDNNDDPSNFSLDSVSGVGGEGTVSILANEIHFDTGTDFDSLDEGVTTTTKINYTMSDDLGAASNSSLTITVTGVNDAPVAVADITTITQDQNSFRNLLTNDTDVDANDNSGNFSLDSVTNAGIIAGVGSVTGILGTASILANQLFFQTGGAFDALDSASSVDVLINYTMSDDNGVPASSSSTMIITINGVNDNPNAVSDVAAINQQASVTVGVLANDTDVDDTDSFALGSFTLDIVNAVGFGTASIVANELFYDAGNALNFLGLGEQQVVTVNYTMSDNEGATASSSTAVTVTGLNDAPVAINDIGNLNENQTITLDVLDNDTDVDQNDVLSLDSFNNITGLGTLSISGGELKFDPGSAFDVLDATDTQNIQFSYVTSDLLGITSSGTVNVTVQGQNDAPVAVNDDFTGVSISEDATDHFFAILQNDTDVDGDDNQSNFGIENITLSENLGSAIFDVVGLDRGIVYSLDGDFDFLADGETRLMTIESQTEDVSKALSNTSELTFEITGVNDAPVLASDNDTVFFNAPFGAAVTLDNDIGLSDVDTTDKISGATISITNNFQTGDVLDVDNGLAASAGITESYDSGTGILTLSGNATAAQYANLLQSATFDSSSSSTSNRTVSFDATDDSGTGSSSSNTENVTVNVSDASSLIQQYYLEGLSPELELKSTPTMTASNDQSISISSDMESVSSTVTQIHQEANTQPQDVVHDSQSTGHGENLLHMMLSEYSSGPKTIAQPQAVNHENERVSTNQAPEHAQVKLMLAEDNASNAMMNALNNISENQESSQHESQTNDASQSAEIVSDVSPTALALVLDIQVTSYGGMNDDYLESING